MHIPVLLQETIEIFKPTTGQQFVDATADGGGHTFAIWERIKPSGTILAIDKDRHLIATLAQKAAQVHAHIIAAQGSFTDLPQILHTHGIERIDGILFDLGYSSYHIEEAGRGFTFQKDEPLDMRYDVWSLDGITAAEVVNRYPERELADIIFRFGEERYARKIAKAIAEVRKKTSIRTSRQLAEAVERAVPRRGRRIHPATKTFQALRIFVNRELDELEEAIPHAIEALVKGGTVIIISFHSLEDRIVKHTFRSEQQKGTIQLPFKKPIIPGAEEMKKNPRARSAKLRAAIKL